MEPFIPHNQWYIQSIYSLVRIAYILFLKKFESPDQLLEPVASTRENKTKWIFQINKSNNNNNIVWLMDNPESYPGGSLTPGGFKHVEQVKG